MKATIGIEIHVELKSNLKVFSQSKNNFNDDVNTNISLIDYGYPGTLPTFNKEIIDLALKACIACDCEISKEMHFDRKNYFYPDLPKGYQITQKDTPIGYNGFVKISNKNIELERIHIEEDTCKSVHGTNTLLNFNRAGVPLIEIVTKPCMETGEEAVEYVEKLREILLYLDISDVKIEEGSMRCDVNVSVSDNDTLGTKCEVKNIGSISAVKTAINYEIERQTKIINDGGVIKEQTRRFDEKTNTTILMREKETGNDYRYFSEPDIPKIILTDDWIEKIKNNLPLLPEALRKKLIELGLNDNNIKTLIANKSLSYFLLNLDCNKVIAANILTGDILAYLNKNALTLNETKLTSTNFEKLVNALDKNEVTNNQVKNIIINILEKDSDVLKLIEEVVSSNLTDEQLETIITNVLNSNLESIVDFKEGKDKAIKYLMGQVMKESKGKANPVVANTKLIEMLKSR